jgi:hypothetical protein
VTSIRRNTALRNRDQKARKLDDEASTAGAAHQVRENRCLLLFVSLVVLLVAMPFLADTVLGRGVLGLLNGIVLLGAVAAVERSKVSVLIAAALALPTLALQILALGSGMAGHFALSWGFGALFYLFALVHLLLYVLHRDVMTADKLYGAVAAYIMVGLFWAFTFGVLQYFYPGAYAYHGTAKVLDLGELIFFSFTVLTTAGFGDITPMLMRSRFLTMFEAVTGVMYVAILIARLTGVYPVITERTRRNAA